MTHEVTQANRQTAGHARFKCDEALIQELELVATTFERDRLASTAQLLRKASARLFKLSLRKAAHRIAHEAPLRERIAELEETLNLIANAELAPPENQRALALVALKQEPKP